MAGSVNLASKAHDVRKSVALQPYSKVIINVQRMGEETISYIAGNDTGAVLEFDCPWGTQAMANNLLTQIQGFQYQPYTVQSGIMYPPTELGDGVTTNGVYGGMYQMYETFGHTFYSDFSAPQDEQMESEYKVESRLERRLSRQEAYSKANFQIQNDNINACVTKEGGNATESFSWKLLSNEFGMYSGSSQVFKCNENGIEVTGKIVAKSGVIGAKTDGTGGFNIEGNKLWSLQAQYGYLENGKQGVYVGTDGIGLGNGNFFVTRAGSLTAKSGYIGNGSNGFKITDSSIQNNKDSIDATKYSRGIYLGVDGISLGRYNIGTSEDPSWEVGFKVTDAGKLIAQNAEIRGKITANTGRIGSSSTDGFVIGTKSIYKDQTTYNGSEPNAKKGVYIGTNGIGLGAGNFSVSANGTLTAKSGYIGDGVNGFTIKSKYIHNGKAGIDNCDNEEGVYIGVSGISLGRYNKGTEAKPDWESAFRVNNKGALIARNASITGTITANKGKLGSSTGFVIDTNKIYKTQSTYDGSASGDKAGVYVGTDGIGLGKGKFYVTSSGNLFASNVIITGKILNGKTKLDDVENAKGLYIGTDGIAIGRKETGKDKNGNPIYEPAFKVTSSGTLTAYSGTFSGKVYVSQIIFKNTDGTTATLDGSHISSGTIGSSQLGDGSVTNSKITGVDGSKVGSGGGGVPRASLDNSSRTSLGNGDSAVSKVNSLMAGSVYASDLCSTHVHARNLHVDYGQGYMQAHWRQYKDGDGTSHFYLCN